MGTLNPLLQISTEALYEYKNPLLAANLRDAFHEYAEDTNEDSLAKRLVAIAKTFFNINLEVEYIDGRGPAYVTHEEITDMSLIRYNAKRFSNSEHTAGKGIRAIVDETKGWIDPKTLKVGGIFADLKVRIYLSRSFIEPKPKADQNYNDDTGIVFLHEIGHYLGYVLLCVNQFIWYGVVDSMVRGIRGANTNEESIQFVKDTSGKFNFVVSEMEDLKGTDTDEALKTKLLTDATSSKQGLLYGSIAQHDAEILADELPAGVFGARQAAVVINNMMAKTNHPAYSPSASFYGAQFAVFATALLGSVIFPPVAILAGISAALYDVARTPAMTHPDPLTRLQRFRTLLLSDAKSSEVTREQATRIANDLKIIDEAIEQLNLSNGTVTEWLTDLFGTQRSKTQKLTSYERMINELQNNTLYLRAAQLRALKG